MNFRKMLPLAMGAYVIPFAITAAASLALGAGSVASGIVGIVSTIVILVLFVLLYFKTARPSAKEGFFFGVAVAVIGIIIDTAITLATDPTKSAGNTTNPAFWVAVLMVIVIPILVGFSAGRKRTKQKKQIH